MVGCLEGVLTMPKIRALVSPWMLEWVAILKVMRCHKVLEIIPVMGRLVLCLILPALLAFKFERHIVMVIE